MNELQKSVLHWLADVDGLNDIHEDQPDFLRTYFRERERKTEGAGPVPLPQESRLSPLEW